VKFIYPKGGLPVRILLTGSTGFLGSRANESLRSRYEVQALPSDLLRGEMTPAREEALYAAAAAFAPQILLHTAAISDTGYAEAHPEESYLANMLLPETLARICARAGCGLVACSSDQVYNGCEVSGPFAEDTPLAPVNVYGRHKLEAERRVADILPGAVSLRLSWMYDLPACGLPTHRNLLTNLLAAALHAEPLRLSDTDFRGVTYVRDVVRALPAALVLPGGTYNFGSDGVMNVAQIALGWCRSLGLPPATVQPIAGKPRSLCMDCARAAEQGIHFEDSIEGIQSLMDDCGWSRLFPSAQG